MITHPEKVLFPADGITKGELASYYEAIAPLMVPHISGRPITGRAFADCDRFQKDAPKGFPDWFARVEVPKKGGTVHHPLVSDARSLVWLANQNCITPHVWISRVPDLYQPDLCVFDLDPAEDRPNDLREAAIALRNFLQDLGLNSWIKTSGSKGFHVVVPLDRQCAYSEVASFAHRVGRVLVSRHPNQLTQEFAKADRGGRILMDTGRNEYSATFAAVYAVRPRQGAPISAPCTWHEVESGAVGPQTITLRDIQKRIADVGELWAEMLKEKQSLLSAIEQLKGCESAH